MKYRSLAALLLLFSCLGLLSGCGQSSVQPIGIDQIPAYAGQAYLVINNNEPYFTESDLTTSSFETYTPLDSLGRCGTAYANIGLDLMPTQERGSISQVKPSGWQTAKYDFVDGKYLYNRCHLIGYQLTAENANTKNLITGTRYLNTSGMLPFENMTADYIKETGNHVLYRVTPLFQGSNLVADGVLMEGYSVEDKGDGICFCVFVYNVQPGVTIDYATGMSNLTDSETSSSSAEETYVINVKSGTFHLLSCSSVETIREANKQTYFGSRDALVTEGYSPCGRCKP